LKLRLPVLLNKFLQATPIAAPDFVTQWRALVGPPNKLQEVVRNYISAIIVNSMCR
jgi:hypothetical protein